MSARDIIRKLTPKLVTLALVFAATIAAYALYARYTDRPWTRDAQVRAVAVKVAPRVSGYLVEVNVSDNQFVRNGDLLFRIDPSSYQLAVDQAQVALDQARQQVTALEAAVRAAEATVQQRNASVESAQSQVEEAQAGVISADAAIKESESGVASARASIAQFQAQLEEAQREAARAKRLAQSRAGSVETAESKAAAVLATQAQLDNANAGLQQAFAAIEKAEAARSEAVAKVASAQSSLIEAQAAVATAIADKDQAVANLGEPGEGNVNVRNAQSQLDQALLDFQWTSIYAPADGYVTNMNLLESTYVSPGTPFALFVDSASFRVDAYFQETKLKNIKPGDRATVTLMGHHDTPLAGQVESIGYAINPPNLAETEGPENLVPTIQPTFDWIRLAQRVPVRIRLNTIPEGLHIVSGMTASVSIEK